MTRDKVEASAKSQTELEGLIARQNLLMDALQNRGQRNNIKIRGIAETKTRQDKNIWG